MYDKLISLENIFLCWNEFKKGKKNKLDVQIFERFLEDNIFVIHEELASRTYRHSSYKTFHIQDPKPRIISKATVRDRIIHHLVFKELDTIFDPGFIFHSYASRKSKGTHLAVKNLSKCLHRVSKNYTHSVYALKCDIKNFFYSVSHQKLFGIIKNRVKDTQFLWLIWEIISSFFATVDNFPQRERET